VPTKEKVELFTRAAKLKDYHHRVPAMYALKDLDKTRFDALMLAAIQKLDPKDELSVRATNYTLKLAVHCDDPGVWKTLQDAIARAPLGMRLMLLGEFCDPSEPRRRADRLRLMADVLDDPSLRELLSGKDSAFATFDVRDFVGTKIPWLLGVEVDAKAATTPEQWERIRQQVREALKRELAKTKE
jgi:hypothetical protein